MKLAMKTDVICGQLRIEARANAGDGDQWHADIQVRGAARPRTLIARVCLDPTPGWGNKGGRMRGGWHIARVVGRRRIVALAYYANTGLPVAPHLIGAPAYAWWPQQRVRRHHG